ncbi:hypothetical protein NP233_g7801 [Leucocoprinus birnbaumii]|uniref:Cation efflux protein transmembrane domain-containing protein n=1 Tax=Leucocoprinus birnbaumii TaxID=56174 RepID=A0AAD5YUA9_9AGAR|nr:hypothetical protein NP233_g7801 [Leucocoprinus birnbaumii]
MKNTTRIAIVLGITLSFFIAEITGAVRLTPSLLSPAHIRNHTSRLKVLHSLPTRSVFPKIPRSNIINRFRGVWCEIFSSITSISIAFFAAYLQDRGKHTTKFTYALHRAELVGAFFNGVFLIALALSIFLQSLDRFVHLEVIKKPLLVLVISLNSSGDIRHNPLITSAQEHHHDHEHGQPAHAVALKPEIAATEDSISDSVHAKHNHTVNPPAVVAERNLGLLGVLIHILGDTINNIGVIIAAVIMWKTEPHNFESILC